MKPSRRRFRFVLLGAFAAISLLFLFFLGPSDALPILTSNPNFRIATTITLGTNHVYHYGDAIQRAFDPVITRLTDTNAYRLRQETPQPATMIWIRLNHPDFRLGPSVLLPTPTGPVRKSLGRIPDFRAILKDSAGTETILDRISSLQQYKQKAVIGGYLLPGPLDAYRGATLLLQRTNHEEVATFRIP